MVNTIFCKKYMLFFISLAIFALAPLTAEAANLRIVNSTGVELHAIYISDGGVDDWEENIIEGAMLPPGNELTVQIQGSYSTFDLRVEDEDGNYENYYDFPGNTRRIELKGNGNSTYR